MLLNLGDGAPDNLTPWIRRPPHRRPRRSISCYDRPARREKVCLDGFLRCGGGRQSGFDPQRMIQPHKQPS